MCLKPIEKEVSLQQEKLSNELKPTDKWLEKFNYDEFTKDIKELGRELEKNQGEDDVRHLNKMIMWSNTFGIVGLCTMGFGVNLVSILGLSTFIVTRWTMIAHHTCHGGYDKCHPNKGRFHRFKFALGSTWKRMCDWFDWMLPEAWNVEHNNKHHYHLSELDDPDLVENNLDELRAADMPKAVKYLLTCINMMTWKWNYYAPNTYKELKMARYRREGREMPEGFVATDAITLTWFLRGGSTIYTFSEFFQVVMGPYLLVHFFIMPLPLLFIGQYLQIENMYSSAVKNLFLADLVTNLHAFIIIVTNHAGNDMYRFRDACRPFSGSFFLRQVLASVNFWTGSDINDFFHGWLNYQIEHHMWPNLSMLSYQKAAPRVKEICKKHGVPYVQENVFLRLKKTIDIMVGNDSMLWFPEEYEKKYLEMDAIAYGKQAK